MRIQMQVLIGLICACIVGYHYFHIWGILMAFAVYGLWSR